MLVLVLVLGLIGLTHALLNRPNRLVALAVRRTYPVYVVHVPPAIAISIAILSMGLDPTKTVVLGSVLTILLCLALYLLLVSSTPLDWLFGGYTGSWFKWPWRTSGWS